MNSAEPSYARTGAIRDSGIPGIPRGVAPQCKIIPNAPARIFRGRSRIIAAGLLALTAFAMLPVDNAEAQSPRLRLTLEGTVENGAISLPTGGSRNLVITNNGGSGRPTIRLQFSGLGTDIEVTDSGARFPGQDWTLTINAPVASSTFISRGLNQAFGRISGPNMVVGGRCDACVIAEWELANTLGAGRNITFTLKAEFGSTGTLIRPGLVNRGDGTSVRIPDYRNGNHQFRRIPTASIQTSLLDGDSILRENDPYRDATQNANDSHGDSATIVMDLHDIPLLPSAGNNDTAATINFSFNADDIPAAAIGPGPNNGTNDFRFSPQGTGSSNTCAGECPAEWTANTANGSGTIAIRKRAIETANSRSSSIGTGPLGVAGAVQYLNRNDSVRILMRLEPWDTGDTSVERITFTIDSVDIPGSSNIGNNAIVNGTQNMTIEPSSVTDAVLARAAGGDTTIFTNGEVEEFSLTLAGVDTDLPDFTHIEATLNLAGTLNRMLEENDAQGMPTSSGVSTLETTEYTITLPDSIDNTDPNNIQAFPPDGGTPQAQLVFRIPRALFLADQGSITTVGEERITFALATKVATTRPGQTVSVSVEDIQIQNRRGNPLPGTSSIPERGNDNMTLTYTTDTIPSRARLSGGAVDLIDGGGNSGTFTLHITDYITDTPGDIQDDVYIRMDLAPPTDVPASSFRSSSNSRSLSNDDYIISIPNNGSGAALVALTGEDSAFRLVIPADRFFANDTAGTIRGRGAENVTITVTARNVPPNRYGMSTFSITSVSGFDVASSSFTGAGIPRERFSNNAARFTIVTNTREFSAIIIPESTAAGGVSVMEGMSGTGLPGNYVDVGTIYINGANPSGLNDRSPVGPVGNRRFVTALLTATVAEGTLTIMRQDPDDADALPSGQPFDAEVVLVGAPAPGVPGTTGGSYSGDEWDGVAAREAEGRLEPGFIPDPGGGRTATKLICVATVITPDANGDASGNSIVKIRLRRGNDSFPTPEKQITFTLTDIQQLGGGNNCSDPVDTSLPTVARASGSATATLTDNDADIDGYLLVELKQRNDVNASQVVEGDIIGRDIISGEKFTHSMELKITSRQLPTTGPDGVVNIEVGRHIKLTLNAQVESGGLTTSVPTGFMGTAPDIIPIIDDPLADFSLSISTSSRPTREAEFQTFTGFGNKLSVTLCLAVPNPTISRRIFLVPRAFNNIAEGDKKITFSISNVFFPDGPNTPAGCLANNGRNNPFVRGGGSGSGQRASHHLPFVPGPSITLRDAPLIPEFIGGTAIDYTAPEESDGINLDLDYERHIKNHVVQHRSAALAGVTHFNYLSQTDALVDGSRAQVRRCNNDFINNGTVIDIDNLNVDCDVPANDGKGFLVKGQDDDGTNTVINFRLRNAKRLIGTVGDDGHQAADRTVFTESEDATLNFVDALGTDPGISQLTISGVVYKADCGEESLCSDIPAEAPFNITTTLTPSLPSRSTTIAVTPVDIHATSITITDPHNNVVSVNSGADTTISGISSGDTIQITVTSRRGAVRTYTITAIFAPLTGPNNNPTIDILEMVIGPVHEDVMLDQVRGTGTATIAANTEDATVVTVSADPQRDNARISVISFNGVGLVPHLLLVAQSSGRHEGNLDGFLPGENVLVLRSVQSINPGTIADITRDYTITVIVPSRDAKLRTLNVDTVFHADLSGDNNAGSVTIRQGTTVALLSAAPGNPLNPADPINDRATITDIAGRNADNGLLTSNINDKGPGTSNTVPGPITAIVSGLTTGANAVTVTVSPEDAATPDVVHTITVTVPPDAASLSHLTVADKEILLNADNPFQASVTLSPLASRAAIIPELIPSNVRTCTYARGEMEDGNPVPDSMTGERPCRGITISHRDTVAGTDVSERYDANANNGIYNAEGVADGSVITIVVISIDAANETSTHTYRITTYRPGRDAEDAGLDRVLVDGQLVTGDSVRIGGGLSSAAIEIIPSIFGASVIDIVGPGSTAITSTPHGRGVEATIPNLIVGINEITFSIRSSNNSVTRPYTVFVTVPFSAAHDARLRRLDLNGQPAMLNDDDNTGTITLAADTRAAEVVATAFQNDGTTGAIINNVTGTNANSDSLTGTDLGGSATRGVRTFVIDNLIPSDAVNEVNTIEITVLSSATQNRNTRTYVITVRIPTAASNNAALTSLNLTPDGDTARNVTIPAAFPYQASVNLPAGTEAVAVNAAPAVAGSAIAIAGVNAQNEPLIVSGTGITNLTTGVNNIRITVTALNTDTRTYTVSANVSPNRTTLLNRVEVAGVLVNLIHGPTDGVGSGTVPLLAGTRQASLLAVALNQTSTVPSVSGPGGAASVTANPSISAGFDAVLTSLSPGSNTILVRVRAAGGDEGGSDDRVYTITVMVETGGAYSAGLTRTTATALEGTTVRAEIYSISITNAPVNEEITLTMNFDGSTAEAGSEWVLSVGDDGVGDDAVDRSLVDLPSTGTVIDFTIPDFELNDGIATATVLAVFPDDELDEDNEVFILSLTGVVSTGNDTANISEPSDAANREVVLRDDGDDASAELSVSSRAVAEDETNTDLYPVFSLLLNNAAPGEATVTYALTGTLGQAGVPGGQYTAALTTGAGTFPITRATGTFTIPKDDILGTDSTVGDPEQGVAGSALATITIDPRPDTDNNPEDVEMTVRSVKFANDGSVVNTPRADISTVTHSPQEFQIAEQALSSDSTLVDDTGLTVGGNQLSPDFRAATLTDYTVTINEDTATINAIPTDSNIHGITAQLTPHGTETPLTAVPLTGPDVNGTYTGDLTGFVIGDNNRVSVVVTPLSRQTEDISTYTLTATRLSDNTDLSALRIGTNNIITDSDSNNIAFAETVILSRTATSATVTATLSDATGASFTVAVNGVGATAGTSGTAMLVSPLVDGNIINIVVTAANGDTRNYNITVMIPEAFSTISRLLSLEVGGVNVTDLNHTANTGSVILPAAMDPVAVSARATDDGATVTTITGPDGTETVSGAAGGAFTANVSDLNNGNTFTIAVQAENPGTQVRTYTITVIFRPSMVTGFTATPAMVSEDGGEVTVTITLDEPVPAGESSISVPFRVTDLVAGDISLASTTGSVVIAAGNASNTATFTLVDNNQVAGGTSSFSVEIDGAGYALPDNGSGSRTLTRAGSAPNSRSITILNNDANLSALLVGGRTVTVTGNDNPLSAEVELDRGVNSAMVTATLSDAAGASFTVAVNGVGATAGTSGTAMEVTPLASGNIINIVVTAASGDIRRYNITVVIPEVFSTISTLRSLEVGGVNVTNLNDNDNTGSVILPAAVDPVAVSARATDDGATVTTITGPDGTETVSGAAGGAFTADVSGLNNGNTFTIAVQAENPGTQVRTYTITVIFRPSMVTGFTATPAMVSEDGGEVTVTITLDEPVPAGESSISVPFRVTDLVAGDISLASTTGSVVIAAGNASNTATFTLVDNNQVAGGTSSFSVEIDGAGYALPDNGSGSRTLTRAGSAPNSRSITILNNDANLSALVVGGRTVTVTGNDNPLSAEVTLDNEVDSAMVTATLSDATGASFTVAVDGGPQVTGTSGVAMDLALENGDAIDIIVTAQDRSTREYNISILIPDEDPVATLITRDLAAAEQGAATGVFFIELDELDDRNSNIIIPYTFSGTATISDDYTVRVTFSNNAPPTTLTTTSGSLTVPMGALTGDDGDVIGGATITISPVSGDNVVEGPEAVRLRIETPSSPSGITASGTPADIMIADDPADETTATVSVASPLEEGAMADVTVTLTANKTLAVDATFMLTFVPGTADSNDVTLNRTRVIINAGGRTATASNALTIVDDDELADQTFSLTINSATSTYATSGDDRSIALRPLVIPRASGDITITGMDSDDDSLSGLTVTPNGLATMIVNPPFTDVDVPTGTTMVTISATATQADAEVISIGGITTSGRTASRENVAVSDGDTIRIVVRAENNIDTENYDLVINVLSNDDSLSVLTVTPAGEAAMTVDSPFTDVDVPAGTMTVTISATATQADAEVISIGGTTTSGQTASRENISISDGDTIRIVVRAENNIDTENYDLVVNVLSNDDSLSGLTVTPTGLAPMTVDSPFTDVDVPAGTMTVTISATAANADAEVISIGGTTTSGRSPSLPNVAVSDGLTIPIVVRAENRDERTYNLVVNVLSNDATLSGLTVTPAGEAPMTVDEPFTAVNLPFETEIIAISATAAHLDAEVISIGGTTTSGQTASRENISISNGDIIRIVVQAENDDMRTYELVVSTLSDDDSLASLTVDRVDVSLNHDNNTGVVTLLHAAIMHVPIMAMATDDGAMIRSIAGQAITNPGQTAMLMNAFVSNGRTFTVVVRAENYEAGDEERTYTITVIIPTTPQDTSQLRPMASVSPSTRTIPETDGTVTIFVRLNRPVSETVELPFTITAIDPADADADPADADDYGIGFPPNCIDCDEATDGTLVFAADERQQQITFTATPDTDAEGDQDILFKLNSGTQGMNLGAVIVPNTAQATITIRDDDIPPTSVSVSASRTRVREDAGTATITVTLNSTAVTGPNIIIPFTFPDSAGATFDTDYTVTSDECHGNCNATGNLTFATGDRVKTLTITGIDDTPPDPETEDPEVEDETIIFQLLAGPDTGTVTVDDADEVTLTLAKDVTDMMETMRDVEVVTSLTGIKQVGMITGLIRQRFSDTVPAPSFGDIGSGTSGSGSTLNANAIADDPDFGAPSFSMDLPDNPETLGDLLNGFGFNTYARADAGGVWSMWVRGQYTSMDGSTTQESPTEDINPTLSYDGSATGVGLGMEWAGENTIIGIAADYITTVLDISTTSENITLSKYKETILLAAPYFALRRDKSHSFWMSLGVGSGTANATLDGTTRTADVKAGFANAGIDITIAADAHEFVAGLSGSAIRKETDPFTFDDTIIPKVTTDSFQARGDITYAHTIGVGGGSMRPYIGLSTIHDFGDTPSDDEHALGLRSGITFSGLNLDLNLEGSSEFLRDDHKQWTISGNARFHSNPDNSGLSLSLDGSRGGDVGAGIEGSYGLPIRRFHPDAMLTPFAALRREDDGNEVVSGMRFSLGDGLDIDLQNTRRTHDDNETAVNLRFHREF